MAFTKRAICMQHLNRYTVGAGILALTAGLAACGSSSGGNSSGGASKAPITIGLLTSITGPYAEVTGGGVNGADAYAKWVNSHGGVAGHKLVIKAFDDAGSTTQSLASARAAVAQGVTALVSTSYVLTSAEPYLQSAKIPVVGSDVDPGFAQGKYFFSIFGDTFSVSPVQAVESYYMSTVLHASKIAYVTSNTAGLVLAMQSYVKVGTDYFNETPVYTNYNIDVTNTTALLSVAEAIKSSGAQAVLGYLSGTEGPQLQVDLNNIGSKAVVIGTENGNPSVPSQYGSPVNGYTYAAVVAPVTATDDPGIKQYISAMGASSPYLQTGEAAYASVAMIVGAMDKAAAAGEPITSANVAAQLNKLDNDNVGGLLAPLSYPQDHAQFDNCYAYEQVQNGKWVRTTGTASNPFICKSEPKP
jgi:ABC-type branched-subunit amino acid transport system substrate-binding protein